MFRRALRLGSRVAVASTAAVVPVTAAACLSDSNTTYKCRNQQSPDALFWSAVLARIVVCVHQAVLECLAANESTYKFKPSVALKRHQSLNDLDVQDDDVALADASEQVPAKEADPAENAVAVAVN